MADAKTVSIVDEPTTLIISKHGWLRSRQGHHIDPAQLAFRSGDSLLACLPCRTVDHLILLDTKGRAYSIPASDMPGGKGDGVPATSLADFVVGGKLDRDGDLPQYRLEIDRSAAARYGLNVMDVQDVVEMALAGKVATELWEGDRHFSVVVTAR